MAEKITPEVSAILAQDKPGLLLLPQTGDIRAIPSGPGMIEKLQSTLRELYKTNATVNAMMYYDGVDAKQLLEKHDRNKMPRAQFPFRADPAHAGNNQKIMSYFFDPSYRDKANLAPDAFRRVVDPTQPGGLGPAVVTREGEHSAPATQPQPHSPFMKGSTFGN